MNARGEGPLGEVAPGYSLHARQVRVKGKGLVPVYFFARKAKHGAVPVPCPPGHVVDASGPYPVLRRTPEVRRHG